MPYILTDKGVKSNFSKAKLSSILTYVWLSAYGEADIHKHRKNIISHTQNLWKLLAQEFGDGDLVEWNGVDIGKAIGKYIEDNASWEVSEVWLSLKIDEFKSASGEHTNSSTTSTKKYLNNKSDPIWGIYPDLDIIHAQKENKVKESPDKPNLNFGTPITPGRFKAQKTVIHYRPTQKKSDWLSFWKWLINYHNDKDFPLGDWLALINNQTKQQKLSSIDGWWDFWNSLIDKSLAVNPQLYKLRKYISLKKRRNAISGFAWLEDTPLLPNHEVIALDNTQSGLFFYKKLAIEYLKTFFKKEWPEAKIDWDLIATHLNPSDDEKLSWGAIQSIDNVGGLRLISDTLTKWSNDIEPLKNAKELPMWAFMRASIALAIEKTLYQQNELKDIDLITKRAIYFFKMLSSKRLLVSSATLRESGKRFPVYFDDGAWLIEDNYQKIQESIYESSLSTLWSGSRTIDVSQLRAKDAPIKNGKRKSSGLSSILDVINSQVKMQDRSNGEMPINITIPIWHKDLPTILEKKQTDELNEGVQITVLFTDLFIKRVFELGKWTLFDPYVYPEIAESENNYILCENLVKERRLKHLHGSTEISAERIFKTCASMLGNGKIQINFTSVSEAFSNNLGKIIYGRDGIGSFSVPNEEIKSTLLEWPSLAINLSNLIDDDGSANEAFIKESIEVAFDICDILYKGMERQMNKLSSASLELKPICIGFVGMHEAILKARDGSFVDTDDISLWIQRFSMLIGTQSVVADAELSLKYGAAPILDVSPEKYKNYHPLDGYKKLVEKRGGSLEMRPPNEVSLGKTEEMPSIFGKNLPRFTSRLVFAPFQFGARIAGVTPGGFGTLFPYEKISDENGVERITPSAYLLLEMESNKNADYQKIFENPSNYKEWPKNIKNDAYPNIEDIRKKMVFASKARPWIDQGVSITLPINHLKLDELMSAIKIAWSHGIDNIRIE